MYVLVNLKEYIFSYTQCTATPGIDYTPLEDYPVTIPARVDETSFRIDMLINDNFTEALVEEVVVVSFTDLPRIEFGFGGFSIIDEDSELIVAAGGSFTRNVCVCLLECVC